jgi:hypothetical protein
VLGNLVFVTQVHLPGSEFCGVLITTRVICSFSKGSSSRPPNTIVIGGTFKFASELTGAVTERGNCLSNRLLLFGCKIEMLPGWVPRMRLWCLDDCSVRHSKSLCQRRRITDLNADRRGICPAGVSRHWLDQIHCLIESAIGV